MKGDREVVKGASMSTIDLNSDLGEGAGTEAAIMPSITSANVACGAHAGDETTMRDAVRLARSLGVGVGAHPGYRDPVNFGRKRLDVPFDDLVRDLSAQIELLASVARSERMSLAHVKPHGALYNQAERDDNVARAVAKAVRASAPDVLLFAPPGSALERAAAAAGLRVAREGFLDRAYEPDGTLRSRALPNSMVTDPAAAAAQALSFARDGGVRAHDGTFLDLRVDTLCIHGDSPGAPAIARAAREALERNGVRVQRVQ
jgi:UPF0271 protein